MVAGSCLELTLALTLVSATAFLIRLSHAATTTFLCLKLLLSLAFSLLPQLSKRIILRRLELWCSGSWLLHLLILLTLAWQGAKFVILDKICSALRVLHRIVRSVHFTGTFTFTSHSTLLNTFPQNQILFRYRYLFFYLKK